MPEHVVRENGGPGDHGGRKVILAPLQIFMLNLAAASS